MAKVGFFLTFIFFFVVQLSFAAYSPAPAPSFRADSSPQLAPTPVTDSPDSAPSISPEPFPSDLALGNSIASSPAPSPYDASDINAGGMEEEAGGEGGMKGGKRAGVVIAVVAAACLVSIGGLVYKKRQDNIRRAQYGYAATREML
ncbi:hypothetical protein GQ457_12G029560 [Hibiscus cannabinus]